MIAKMAGREGTRTNAAQVITMSAHPAIAMAAADTRRASRPAASDVSM